MGSRGINLLSSLSLQAQLVSHPLLLLLLLLLQFCLTVPLLLRHQEEGHGICCRLLPYYLAALHLLSVPTGHLGPAAQLHLLTVLKGRRASLSGEAQVSDGRVDNKSPRAPRVTASP